MLHVASENSKRSVHRTHAIGSPTASTTKRRGLREETLHVIHVPILDKIIRDAQRPNTALVRVVRELIIGATLLALKPHGTNGDILFDPIVHLVPVFDIHVAALEIVEHILLHERVVCAVNDNAALLAAFDCIPDQSAHWTVFAVVEVLTVLASPPELATLLDARVEHHVVLRVEANRVQSDTANNVIARNGNTSRQVYNLGLHIGYEDTEERNTQRIVSTCTPIRVPDEIFGIAHAHVHAIAAFSNAHYVRNKDLHPHTHTHTYLQSFIWPSESRFTQRAGDPKHGISLARCDGCEREAFGIHLSVAQWCDGNCIANTPSVLFEIAVHREARGTGTCRFDEERPGASERSAFDMQHRHVTMIAEAPSFEMRVLASVVLDVDGRAIRRRAVRTADDNGSGLLGHDKARREPHTRYISPPQASAHSE